jgi:hypothetical protein
MEVPCSQIPHSATPRNRTDLYIPNKRPSECTFDASPDTPLGNFAGSGTTFPDKSLSRFDQQSFWMIQRSITVASEGAGISYIYINVLVTHILQAQGDKLIGRS